MAKIGCQHLVFCGNDEGSTAVLVGGLISADLTINTSEVSLYADNIRAEYEATFANGTLACNVSDIAPEVKAKVLGVTLDAESKELTYSAADSAPEGKLGYYRNLMVNGTRMFEGVWFDRAKGSMTGTSDSTKGENTAFNTDTINFAISPVESGNYKHEKRFATEAEARTWVNTAVGYTEPQA